MTNEDVIALDQRAINSRQLFANGNQVAWVAEMPGSTAKYVAVFNVGDASDENIRIKFADIGLPDNCIVHDLWDDQDVGTAQTVGTFTVEPHASGLYRIAAAK